MHVVNLDALKSGMVSVDLVETQKMICYRTIAGIYSTLFLVIALLQPIRLRISVGGSTYDTENAFLKISATCFERSLLKSVTLSSPAALTNFLLPF